MPYTHPCIVVIVRAAPIDIGSITVLIAASGGQPYRAIARDSCAVEDPGRKVLSAALLPELVELITTLLMGAGSGGLFRDGEG